MFRFTWLLVFAMLVSIPGIASAYNQPALDEVGSLEVFSRVFEDQNWSVMLDANGTPLAFQLIPVTAGVPDPELNPETAAQFTHYQIQEMVVYTTTMVHNSYEPVATQIQLRLMLFPDDAAAATYLVEAYDTQVQSAEGSEFDARLAPIDPLPAFEYPLVGWTHLTDYVNNTNEQYSGLASTVRYQSQIGRTIISAQVTGPFVDFNFDLALGLISAQAYCLNESPYCSGTTIGEATPDWHMAGQLLTFTTDGTEARWIWPVEEPVRAPEVSASFGSDG